jgi:hypothetical protein
VSEDRARQRGQGGARHVIGVLVALVLLLVVFAGLVEGTRSIKGLGYEPQAVAATTGPNIELSAFPDSYACHGSNGSPGGGPHPDWVTYCPSTSIKVPAHSTITVTIRQYDTGGSVHNPFFAVVRGTVGNVMYLNGKAVQQVNPEEIGHTFTVQTPPDTHQTQLFVNVPLPGVSDTAPNTQHIAGHEYPTPNVIVFRFTTGAPGQYVWHCYVPCGEGLAGEGFSGQAGFGGAMATTGYMSGTLTVS